MLTRAAARRASVETCTPPVTPISTIAIESQLAESSPAAPRPRKRLSARKQKVSKPLIDDQNILRHAEEHLIKQADVNDVKPAIKLASPEKKAAGTPKKAIVKTEKAVATSVKVVKEKREKAHPYGLTPGRTPYPDDALPSPAACDEVYRLLSESDGARERPAILPEPSKTVTGCGGVLDPLDAMIRTYLSSATAAANSNAAFKGLQESYGLRPPGLSSHGQWMVNYEAIMNADVQTLANAIKRGGLANMKAKNIKALLDMVYANNVARYGVNGNANMLSMDHLLEMSAGDAMEEMLKFPGIAVKTASCVILHNMMLPSFAVDTHVLRICKLLGWVPTTADEVKTFNHLEVRVPDDLKFQLHNLFVHHGRICKRCSAKKVTKVEYDEATCSLEHLVDRNADVSRRGSKKRKRENVKEESSEVSDE